VTLANRNSLQLVSATSVAAHLIPLWGASRTVRNRQESQTRNVAFVFTSAVERIPCMSPCCCPPRPAAYGIYGCLLRMRALRPDAVQTGQAQRAEDMHRGSRSVRALCLPACFRLPWHRMFLPL